MKILVTGGAGYIGSHTCVELLHAGHQVLIIDNFSNSSPATIGKIREITNSKIDYVECDIRDSDLVNKIFVDFSPDAVIHFAGLKSVEESFHNSNLYYQVNVNGSINIINAMSQNDCRLIVFSSSATVYGHPKYLPCDERHPVMPINPYGRTKLMIETILNDWVISSKKFKAVCLRYFNPVGSHNSGLIGENLLNNPTNLMPIILQAGAGEREDVKIFGNDYDTRDGTGERDYIHVCDLAIGHLLAIENRNSLSNFEVINLGTGSGTTVKEIISTFQLETGISIKETYVERRIGDVAKSYADTKLATSLLGFKSSYSINDMCNDSWNWKENFNSLK